MHEAIIACSMLENEINQILRAENLQYDNISWVERGLHQSPALLNKKLRELIAALENEYDTIIMCYGLCGNALLGLSAERARLAAMRADDCIHMLLKDSGTDCRCIYLTAGWIDSEKSIENEHAACIAKYGEAKSRRIYKSIYKEYRRLRLLDTGAYDTGRYRERTQSLANTLELEYGEQAGSVEVLQKLLTHNWDEDIITAEPGKMLQFDQG